MYILHSFASPTCFADYHLGVKLWFWVGGFRFYSPPLFFLFGWFCSSRCEFFTPVLDVCVGSLLALVARSGGNTFVLILVDM